MSGGSKVRIWKEKAQTKRTQPAVNTPALPDELGSGQFSQSLRSSEPKAGAVVVA